MCKLLKALYGLRQSSRAWYHRLDAYLLAHNFIRTVADSNLYVRTNTDTTFITVAVYVDDCIVVSPQLSLIHELRSLLEKEFEMSYEGDITFYLGIQVIRNRDEGWLCYSKKNIYTAFFNGLTWRPIMTLPHQWKPVLSSHGQTKMKLPHRRMLFPMLKLSVALCMPSCIRDQIVLI